MDPTVASRVIDIARSQIGTKEDPPNSNRNPYGAALNRNGEPWCAMFVTWCFQQAGAPLPDVNGPGGLFTYCPSAVDYARAHHELVDDPRPGDILLFDWTSRGAADGVADHVGILVSPGATYTTIEGNTWSGNDSDGGAVLERTRTPNQVGWIWRPGAVDGGAGPSPASSPASSPAPTPTPIPMVHPGVANLGQAVVQPGTQGDRVLSVQLFLRVASQLLRDAAMNPGSLGTYDLDTARAVRAWQRVVGATDDGIWGPQTFAASSNYLNAVLPAAVMKPGATGADVTRVQRFLARVAEVTSDPRLDPGGVDGQYGPRMEAAVVALQQIIGADTDGEWGPQTVTRVTDEAERRAAARRAAERSAVTPD